MEFLSGRAENIPYSLSRWTDVPGAKWAWWTQQLSQGHMTAFDPRTGVPGHWSLDPKEVLGLVFWTKDPRALLRDRELVAPYRVKVHVTVTGWEEAERGAPSRTKGKLGLSDTARAFGPENVTWRFSPVPIVSDVIWRFTEIANVAADAGLRRVFLSFLQPNDRIPETRSIERRLEMLLKMSEVAQALDMDVLLCNEDRLLAKVSELPANLRSAVCAPPEDFALQGFQRAPSEGCGCVLMADPFTINESCTMSCTYCYASDNTLAKKKRNTTRRLPLL